MKIHIIAVVSSLQPKQNPSSFVGTTILQSTTLKCDNIKRLF